MGQIDLNYSGGLSSFLLKYELEEKLIRGV